MNGTNLNRLLHLAALLAALALVAQAQAAGLLSEVDDFEVDREGWGVLGGVQPDGGPEGAGDGYFAYASTGGGGSGSRMVIPNEGVGNQWQGDYLAAGVNAFQMDVLNDGASQIDLRIGIANASTWYVSTDPIAIAPGAPWTEVVLQVTADAMTGLGADSFETVAADVRRLRILSSERLPTVAILGGLQGDAIVASIGIDNIRAIPEPTAGLSLIAGLGLATLVQRRFRS